MAYSASGMWLNIVGLATRWNIASECDWIWWDLQRDGILLANDTAPPWSALASISRSDRLQAGGAGLQMPPRTGAELPRRRIHACVGDWVATESSVGFDGQSCRASLSAEDTRRSCIPCGSGSSMEQPTVTCHIIFIVGVIQTQPQDWAVPEIVRSTLISANAPRHLFDFVTCPRSQHWFTSR